VVYPSSWQPIRLGSQSYTVTVTSRHRKCFKGQTKLKGMCTHFCSSTRDWLVFKYCHINIQFNQCRVISLIFNCHARFAIDNRLYISDLFSCWDNFESCNLWTLYPVLSKRTYIYFSPKSYKFINKLSAKPRNTKVQRKHWRCSKSILNATYFCFTNKHHYSSV